MCEIYLKLTIKTLERCQQVGMMETVQFSSLHNSWKIFDVIDVVPGTEEISHVSSIADLEQVNTVSVIPEQFVRKVSRLSFPNNLYKVIGLCVSLNVPL